MEVISPCNITLTTQSVAIGGDNYVQGFVILNNFLASKSVSCLSFYFVLLLSELLSFSPLPLKMHFFCNFPFFSLLSEKSIPSPDAITDDSCLSALRHNRSGLVPHPQQTPPQWETLVEAGPLCLQFREVHGRRRVRRKTECQLLSSHFTQSRENTHSSPAYFG